MTKSPPKVAPRKPRGATKRDVKVRKRNSRTQSQARKLRDNIAAETVRESYRTTDTQTGSFRPTQVPDALRALTERNVAQARELYESSKNTLQAVLESWQQSFGAAGKGAAALNRRFFDLAERNMNTGFDFATNLAGARNVAEVMELQADYFRRVLGELHSQRKRSLSSTRNR
jgi:hypothetical protein